MNEEYTDKSMVALYIYKYNDLPKNYITKFEAFKKYESAANILNNGYSVGGDTFWYKDEITKYTKNTNLKEADIYINIDNLISENRRGEARLVYTRNSKKTDVFYTEDHYDSFEKISLWQIQKTSNVLWIIFIIYSILIIVFFVKINKIKKLKLS